MTKKEYRYLLIKKNLRWEIPLSFLRQFDLAKLTLLNSMIGHQDTASWSAQDYMAYVSRFYYDPAFEACYTLWQDSGYMRSLRPTLDHVRPRADGGRFVLENLQILPWCINRMKGDANQIEWQTVRDLFLRTSKSSTAKTYMRWL